MKIDEDIVVEVRKNREEIFAEFNCDLSKYNEYIMSQRPTLEAAGVRYESEEERQTRIAWNKQQREAQERLLAAL